MKKVVLLSFLLLFTLVSQAWAQTRTVSGRVTGPDGEGLPGVTVVERGTTNGMSTGVNGEYSLVVPENAVLVFSFIGFNTQEIPVSGRNEVNVRMSADARQLGEVVVTAFGIERETKALSYSVQEVSGEAVSRAGQPNVANALQGKVAGVIVRQSSGMPGASATITVRGNRSFTGNNQPLYVVDGMPIASNADFGGAVSGTDASSRALDINPNDIESISVLKGGAAAALYGIRASNGVVVITTKSGRGAANRDKAVVSFNSDYTFDRVSRLPDIQSTYAQGSGGNYQPSTSLSWGPRISSLGTVKNALGEDVDGNRVFDNITPFFRTGYTFNNSINVARATDLGNFNIGLGHTKQEGIIPTTGMTRINAKVAGDLRVNQKVTVGVSANYSDLSVDKVATGSNLSNPLFTLYAAPRTFDLWGLPYFRTGDPFRQVNYRTAIDNPRWSLANNQFYESTRRFFGNINTNYKPLDWLTVNYRLGVDSYLTDGKEVYEVGSGATGGFTAVPGGGQIRDFAVNQNQINSNLSVIFNKDITEDINLNLLVGNEIYDISNRYMNNLGNGTTVPGFRNIGVTTSQTLTETLDRSRVAGFYSSLSVAYKEMLFLDATARQDYVSNLPRGNRSFFYPSAGLAFVFTEALNLTSNILTFGKLRASYAEVGQAPDAPYQTRNIFIKGAATTGFLADGIQFPFNGLNAYTLSNIIRSDQLQPQNTRTIEFGGDLRFLDNRIGIDYTYYKQNVRNQIFNVPVAPSTGFTSETRNAGELQSTGHEVILTITPLRSAEFTWDMITNFSAYRNEVISLAEGVENIFLGGFVTPNVRAQAGSAYPILFGTRYVRDDQGRIVVDSRPTLANGKENPRYGMPLAGPADVLGNVQPDFEVSFRNSLNFKGITLTGQLDWRKGGNMYAGNTRLLKLYGMDAVTEDRESPFVFPGVKGRLGPDGNVIVEGDNDISIVRGQTYWQDAMDAITESNVYSTTFVRLRELTLGYALPTGVVTRIPFRTAELFFTGRNLFLITDYPNFDPETNVGGASNFQGLEYVSLPQVRSFGAGLKVSF
jgi:TonB-linked SusC/RagA family outer membrane protein